MAPYYSQAYLSTEIETADRVSLVISLYEGALAHVAKAMDAIESGDANARSQSINRASRILMALCEALDYTQDGGLAGRLLALYSYQLRQLFEANRKNDIEPLQIVKTTLAILLEGWQTVARSPEGTKMRIREMAERSTNRSPQAIVGTVSSMVLTA